MKDKRKLESKKVKYPRCAVNICVLLGGGGGFHNGKGGAGEHSLTEIKKLSFRVGILKLNVKSRHSGVPGFEQKVNSENVVEAKVFSKSATVEAHMASLVVQQGRRGH
jgi:hypothetical protein